MSNKLAKTGVNNGCFEKGRHAELISASLRNNNKTLKQVQGDYSFLNKRGFTLIELLVVVLIIGILASVALPQYNKAVEKSRQAEAWTNLKSLQSAVQVAQMEKGSDSSPNWEDLSLDFMRDWDGNPATGEMYGYSSMTTKEWGFAYYDGDVSAMRWNGPDQYNYILVLGANGEKMCYSMTGGAGTCTKIGATLNTGTCHTVFSSPGTCYKF